MIYYDQPAPFDGRRAADHRRGPAAGPRGVPKPRPEDALARNLLDAAKPSAEREKLLADASVDGGVLIRRWSKTSNRVPARRIRSDSVDLARGCGGRQTQSHGGNEIPAGGFTAQSG